MLLKDMLFLRFPLLKVCYLRFDRWHYRTTDPILSRSIIAYKNQHLGEKQKHEWFYQKLHLSFGHEPITAKPAFDF